MQIRTHVATIFHDWPINAGLDAYRKTEDLSIAPGGSLRDRAPIVCFRSPRAFYTQGNMCRTNANSRRHIVLQKPTLRALYNGHSACAGEALHHLLCAG